MKFVLTISDPERWYESYVKLTRGMAETKNRTGPLFPFQSEKWSTNEELVTCTAARYWGCDFNNPDASEESKEQCLEAELTNPDNPN